MDQSKIGIYFNLTGHTVVRVTSPYWIPENSEWVMVTCDPNSTLLRVRELICETELMNDSSQVVWTSLP